MPLINKAAVIFISQGLQTHLWCAAWQQKLVKSARSDQISKVLIPSHNSPKSEGPGCCIPSSPGNNRAEWSHLFYSSSSSSPQGVQVGVEICSFRIASDHPLLLPVPFPSLFPCSNFIAPAFLQAVGLTGRSYHPIWWITGQGLS